MRGKGFDFRIYCAAAALLGWARVARLALRVQGLRGRCKRVPGRNGMVASLPRLGHGRHQISEKGVVGEALLQGSESIGDHGRQDR